jgi:hypothetical protein
MRGNGEWKEGARCPRTDLGPKNVKRVAAMAVLAEAVARHATGLAMCPTEQGEEILAFLKRHREY